MIKQSAKKDKNIEKISIIKDILFGEEVERLSQKLESQAADYNHKIETLTKKIDGLEKSLINNISTLKQEVEQNRQEKLDVEQFKSLGETILKFTKNK